ncbi:MAG: helix-turn-helix transcriptional regulator [bacterium]|nr:helix-turn-helix transcriptional regulator [bacterium]
MIVAENLKELMKRNGVSAAQMERDTEGNITQSTLSRILNGERNPRPSTIKKLADYFGLSIGHLLGEVPLPPADYMSEFPAGPCPVGFNEEIWAEVPEQIGDVTAKLLSREYPNAFYRGEVIAGKDKQAVLKVIYYLWLEKLRLQEDKKKRWPRLKQEEGEVEATG